MDFKSKYKAFFYKIPVLFAFIFLLVLGACKEAAQSDDAKMQSFSGGALGTEYHVKFFQEDYMDITADLDSIFERVNQSMSTYRPDSDISKINRGEADIVVDPLFREVFERSVEIYQATEHYFDPTVGPLVNLYGFGPEASDLQPDSSSVDSLMQYVGMDKIKLDADGKIEGKFPGTYIDFNAIAKGYTVDLVGLYLEKKGITDYLVEIGGEIRTKGKNLNSKQAWKLGIDDPRLETNPNELSGVVGLSDKSLATSGNYRKFRNDSLTGEKYVHIINPLSGYMEKTNMLSVSVIADDCATADAYATAFMAMKIETAKRIEKGIDEIDVFYIYDEGGVLQTYLSEGFEKHLVKK